MRLPPAGVVYLILLTVSGFSAAGEPSTSILFSTVDRSKYAFDIYSVPALPAPAPPGPDHAEIRHTHSDSLNFNGHFPANSAVSFLPTRPGRFPLLFVSELNGSSNVYFHTVPEQGVPRRSALEYSLIPTNPGPYPLLTSGGVSMKDRPSIAGDRLIYVSTHEKTAVSRKSWAAVYSTDLKTRATLRLTPRDIADFSPAVSPSGEWTAVASSGEKGWTGEIEDLVTDIYVFRTRDGSERTRVVVHGGWPCWSGDSTIYFHRRSDDGWWSVYRVGVGEDNGGSISAVSSIERITPPGVHVFTPATSAGGENNYIAVATRRPSSEFRHIELFDLADNVFVEITQRMNPEAHHYNPFLSPDGARVGYHRCTGGTKPQVLLENVPSPAPDISLFRIDGMFPSFSPDGTQIAFAGMPGLYVVNRDGSGRRQLLPDTAFATAWDPKRKGVIYTSYGPGFAYDFAEVNVISVHFAGNSTPEVKVLTTGGGNNAFPSPSPDGKRVVFQSGQSGFGGHKNLYIMDAINGEAGSLVRLTDGEWKDIMPNWSPDGQWIAFSSDRERPGTYSFALYKIRPDGSGLRKVVESGVGGGGRINHLWFSPDSKRLVFSSDYAAVSGEPVAMPNQNLCYGEIFVADAEGGPVSRLTHNVYEDGTPTWGPAALVEASVVEEPYRYTNCSFDDCAWLTDPSSVKKRGKGGCRFG